MFELDHDLSQDIVDRAMAILPYNVNVMDSQGLILGSGERERINTRHEGAQQVLASGYRTPDIASEGTHRVSTREMGDAVVAALSTKTIISKS